MGSLIRLPLSRRSRFPGGAVWPTLALLALNLFDAVATARLLDAGGSELNPFMRALWRVSPDCFLALKLLAVTAAGLWLYEQNRTRTLWGLAGLYLVVCLVELWMLAGL